MRKICRLFLLTAVLCALAALYGCGAETDQETKKDVEFTVVEEDSIPAEFLSLIEAQKMEPFFLSYSVDGYLYIAKGYGIQPTGGYSVRVDEVYETDTNLVTSMTLIGPEAGEAVNKMPTYPYAVIKVEAVDKNIIFQ